MSHKKQLYKYLPDVQMALALVGASLLWYMFVIYCLLQAVCPWTFLIYNITMLSLIFISSDFPKIVCCFFMAGCLLRPGVYVCINYVSNPNLFHYSNFGIYMIGSVYIVLLNRVNLNDNWLVEYSMRDRTLSLVSSSLVAFPDKTSSKTPVIALTK